MIANLPELIRRKAALPFQGLMRCESHRRLAPELAYGRHRGPAPKYAYHAAVLVALWLDHDNQWIIPLTLRPKHMADHGGQISLPGGRSDPGETTWRTASRELGEELGCSIDYLQPVGNLSPIYVYASRHIVKPMIGAFTQKPAFRPNPEEVAELIDLPVQDLLSDDAIGIGVMQKGAAQLEAPGFRIQGHFVWGATAMVLAELRTLLLTILSPS
jgi:8-oxo-dGTP pyrophosphatase MutT (NUDIX family)